MCFFFLLNDFYRTLKEFDFFLVSFGGSNAGPSRRRWAMESCDGSTQEHLMVRMPGKGSAEVT